MTNIPKYTWSPGVSRMEEKWEYFFFFCSTALFGWIAVDDEDGFQYLSNRPVWLDARLSDSVGIFRLEQPRTLNI